MKKFLASFAALFLVGVSAQAMFLIDPYLNYAVSGSTSTNYDVSGTEFGARLGLSTLGFGYGVDFVAGGSLTYKNTTTSTAYAPSGYGLFVSYKFPILVRGYASYLLESKIAANGNTTKGTATKIGVQYTGLPFIAIGLETFSGKYTDTNGTALSPSTTDSQTRLAISVPFDI